MHADIPAQSPAENFTPSGWTIYQPLLCKYTSVAGAKDQCRKRAEKAFDWQRYDIRYDNEKNSDNSFVIDNGIVFNTNHFCESLHEYFDQSATHCFSTIFVPLLLGIPIVIRLFELCIYLPSPRVYCIKHLLHHLMVAASRPLASAFTCRLLSSNLYSSFWRICNDCRKKSPR